jgi:hypothetical protein
MLFKRKPLKPFNKALQLIEQAGDIVLEHKRNKHFMPTEADLSLLKQIEDKLFETKCTAEYVKKCLQQRLNGEPEGSTKWHNEEVFNYHYPK